MSVSTRALFPMTASPMTQLLVCDLDGTLLLRGRLFADEDVDRLRSVGAAGGVRAIATGRALATATKVIPVDFPIDYLIFSSGAGILDWRSRELIVTHTMDPSEVRVAMDAFLRLELDFMIHAPIPEQHIFRFHRTGKVNPDFERRLARYAADGRVLNIDSATTPASQLLAVSPNGDPDEPFQHLQRELASLSVIRATSPLDGHSMWIEAFAPNVSKSRAAEWIAQTRGIAREHTLALGNDYNDWDLLRWAAKAAVIADAPAAMRDEFVAVRSLSDWLS